MLASNASDRSYSTSIAASARTISRTAYQTVVTTITHAEIVVTTKFSDNAQPGSAPVLRGTRNCNVITMLAAIAARIDARKMRSTPSCSTTRQAATRK